MTDAALQAALAIFNHQKPPDITGLDPYGDVTKMSSQNVGALHQYFVNMHCFSAQEMTKADVELTAAEYRLKQSKQMLLLQAQITRTKADKKYITDAEIATNPALEAIAHRVTTLGMKKAMLKTASEGLSEKAALYSREITRRESEVRAQQRNT